MKKKGVIKIIVVIILVLIIVNILYVLNTEETDDYEVVPEEILPPETGRMTIIHNNLTKTYDGNSGPIEDANREPVSEVEVTITINGKKYSSVSNSKGIARFSFPEDVIESEVDTHQTYRCMFSKKGFNTLHWDIRFWIEK